MKRKIIWLLILCSLFITDVRSSKESASFNTSQLFNEKSKSENLVAKFNQDYQLNSSLEEDEDEELKELVKKATYYLLGPANNTNETAEDYIKRKNEFGNMRYQPDIPLDENGELDMNSDEFWKSFTTSYVLSEMFITFNDLEAIYKQFDEVVVIKTADGFISLITLNNVKLNVSDEEEPMKFKTIEANLKIYYIFLENNGEYQIYYMFGEFDDEVATFNQEVKEQEYRGLNSVIDNRSKFSSMYDYSKLDNLSDDTVKKIFADNKSKIVLLNTMDNQNISNAGTGFYIDEDLVVTTWSYLEKSLLSGSYITAKDGKNNTLNVEGVVTVDIDNDIALLKVTGGSKSGVILSDDVEVEDACILISTKTGANLSVNLGLIIVNGNMITSLISTSEYEEGAPLFNTKGEVVGMNSSKVVDSYLSKSYNTKALKELQDKFSDVDITNITYITFEELKNNYYVKYGNDKVINVEDKIWNKYKNIGDLENNISLELVKSSYQDGILSLRYKNQMSSIFSNMQLANSFINQLKNDGYEEILSSEMKKVYLNDKYRITIMSEFDYLIIVIMEI